MNKQVCKMLIHEIVSVLDEVNSYTYPFQSHTKTDEYGKLPPFLNMYVVSLDKAFFVFLNFIEKLLNEKKKGMQVRCRGSPLLPYSVDVVNTNHRPNENIRTKVSSLGGKAFDSTARRLGCIHLRGRFPSKISIQRVFSTHHTRSAIRGPKSKPYVIY